MSEEGYTVGKEGGKRRGGREEGKGGRERGEGGCKKRETKEGHRWK